MEQAAKGDPPEVIAEEIVVTTEEIAAEVKEETIEAPCRLRQRLRRLAAIWGRSSIRSIASGSDAAYYGLAGMYGAEFQAQAEDHEQDRPDKGNQV